jgi:hypothetical protein
MYCVICPGNYRHTTEHAEYYRPVLSIKENFLEHLNYQAGETSMIINANPAAFV